MRYTVSIFDPLNEDTDEDRDPDTTYTLGAARKLADTVTSLNPNCIAMIYQRGSYDWADERVGGDYDAACLRRRAEDASR